MKPSRVHLALVLGLAATVGLIHFAPDEDAGLASAKSQTSAPTSVLSSANRSAVLAQASAPAASGDSETARETPFSGFLTGADRPVPPAEVPDLFKSFSWYVPPPPPPPPPPAPPPKPTAPPLPFTYIGQYIEGQRNLYLLARGELLFTVAIGDIIDRTYQVESITGGQLTFVYLPLATKQMLNTGVL